MTTAPQAPLLVTIRDIPILETGIEYPLSTGPATFTTDDLAAAVGAVDDPAVKTPRLKVGHDGTFDGEPAFGVAENLRLTNNGHTVLADFVGVPQWLADVMPYAWPSRSIEGQRFLKTSTGRTHDLVVEAVSLLGVQLPGVNTLADMAGWFGAKAPDGVVYDFDLKGGAQVPAPNRRGVKAAVQVDDLKRAYYESLDSSQMWWWIRAIYLDPPELIVDDDEGGLYRVPFTAKGDDVEFSEPEQVVIQYVDAPASKAKASAALYASRAESRPDTPNQEANVDIAVLRARLGMADDATEEQVLARLDELKAQGEGDEPNPQPDPTPTPQPAPVSPPVNPPPGDNPNPNPQQPGPGQPAVPEGMVMVDAAALAQLQAGAAKGAEMWEQQRKAQRDQEITDAIKAGKFGNGRREHFTKLWELDPEGTKALIAALAPGVVPLAELGSAHNPEGMQDQEAYPKEWLPEIHAVRDGRRSRIVQEVN